MRHQACSALVKKNMLSGVQEGEAPPKIRPPREDDKWFVSRMVHVEFPEVEAFGMPAREMTMLWSIRSRELEVELEEGNLRYIIAALSASDAVVKAEVAAEPKEMASPRRKRRRLKKRPSAEEGGEKAEEG